MKIQTYLIDTFTEKLFSGNPAVVCVMDAWLPDETLQALAFENNQPATAFLVRYNNQYHIRWFAPDYELPLCGHGTLAAAWVVFNILEPIKGHIEFITKTKILKVNNINGAIVIDFPAYQAEKILTTSTVVDGLGLKPNEVYGYQNERCLAVLDNEETVTNLQPTMPILKQLNYRSVIITAQGKDHDFVSRVFYPGKRMTEDAVTGSAHCLLVPFWAERLKKKLLHARQVSPRGGNLTCELHADHITLSGKAVMYMQGVSIW